MQKSGLSPSSPRDILLLTNPIAGGGQRSPSVLHRALMAHGFRCELFTTDDPSWKTQATPDTVVAVAGGDGTVKIVARELVGTGIPLAILPTGTSNNIALALGIFGSPLGLFRRWPDWQTRPFDVVETTTNDQRRLCFEGFGFGLFGRWMHLGKFIPERIPAETRKCVVRQDRKFLSGVVECATADECTLTLNGQSRAANYLMVIAANIGLMGARVPIAPAADPRDGQVDLLMATEADRVPLIRWLRAVAEEDRVPAPPVEVAKTSQLRLEFTRGGYHFDDEAGVWGCDTPDDARRTMRIDATVKPGALQILSP